MAAKKQQEVGNTKKRKRIPSSNTDSRSKKPFKSAKPDSVGKGMKKPFKSSKPDSVGKVKKSAPVTGRERRIHAKELAEARKKKRKRHYSLEQELARLWEKIAKEDRMKYVSLENIG